MNNDGAKQRMGFLVNHKVPSMVKNESINSSTHLFVVGATGRGKTRKILDIHDSRFSQQEGMLWFDPKNVVFREILSRTHLKSAIYRIGIPGEGENDIRVNLFSLLTESEQNMYKFSFNLIAGQKNYENNRFWVESAAKMFFTSVMLFSTMNKLLIYVEEITGSNIDFSCDIVYFSADKPEVEKIINFYIPGRPITFEEFYVWMSDRETFRQLVGNIFKIVDTFQEKIKKCIESKSILTAKSALALDIFFDDIMRFSKEFSTYTLTPDDGSASGTSGVWFTMCSSIPSVLYSDKSLNISKSTHNIKDLLETGKCVIVSINNEQIMSTLFNYYAEYFSARASRADIRPVTIVLEEANRLLQTGVDINLERTISYSRQAKLSIVAVFQSKGQIFDAFGEYVATSILENVTFLTMLEREEGTKTNNLFYKYNEYSIGFDPKFVSSKELYMAELEYQRATNQFSSIEKNRSEVVLFDHFLYEYSKEVVLVDIETLQSRNVTYIPMETKHKNGYFVQKLNKIMMKNIHQVETGF